MKTFIYCRVVPDNQLLTPPETLDGQEAKCRKYARTKQLWPVAVYRDMGAMHSGTFLPNMRRLLRDLAREKEEVLILSDSYLRLGFKLPTRTKLLSLLGRNGGKFLAIDEENSRTNAFLQEEAFELDLKGDE